MTSFLPRLIILFLLPTRAFASDSDAVAVTIKPLLSLVQGVLGEAGDAKLLSGKQAGLY